MIKSNRGDNGVCVCVYDRLKIEYRELAVRTFAGDNRSKPFTYTRTRVCSIIIILIIIIIIILIRDNEGSEANRKERRKEGKLRGRERIFREGSENSGELERR